jgi:hypothetical protein
MNHEHDDDLAPTVDERDEIEREDYPKTRDELEADQAAEETPDVDDENIVGK